MADHGIQTHYFDAPIPAKRGIKYPLRIVKNIVSSLPYAVDVHSTGKFRKMYRDWARVQSFDVWQTEWTPYSSMLDGLGLKTVCVAHNVDSLIWKRYAETETRTLHRIYIREQYRRFKRFERHAFRTADRVVSVSNPDAALMRDMFSIDHVDVVDNGVDVQKYGAVERQIDPDEILFLGSLDWRPNQDAIQLLLDDIFPRVRAKRPASKLSIVGRKPPPAMIAAVAKAPGVTMHADVAEVLPYLARAAVMTIPLRIGGGSRLKMIESLAASVPVVASAIAAEGLRLRPGIDYRLADTAETMAAELVRMLDDPVAAQQTATAGCQQTREYYGWDRLGRQLERSWQLAMDSEPR